MPATRSKDKLSTGVSAHGTMSENIPTTGGGNLMIISKCNSIEDARYFDLMLCLVVLGVPIMAELNAFSWIGIAVWRPT